MPSLILTTTGRRSGQPRRNPLLYVRDGDAFVVIGSNWGKNRQPAWSLNLLADPRATVTIGGRHLPVEARVATGAERERLWGLLLAEWPAYETYVERAGGRDIRVFRLAPLSERSTVPGSCQDRGRPGRGGANDPHDGNMTGQRWAGPTYRVSAEI